MRRRAERAPIVERQRVGGEADEDQARLGGVSTDLCLYEVRDGVALVTFNRPERNNGMNGALELAYFARLAAGGRRPRGARHRRHRCRPVVLPRRRPRPPARARATSRCPTPRSPRPSRSPSTSRSSAAINGGCAGVGLVQALQCDVRFAAAQAKFTTAFARRGLIAEYGVAWLLPRIVGQAAAADLLLSGRMFDAAEALRIGLVTAVVDRARGAGHGPRLRPGPRRQRVAGVDGHDQASSCAATRPWSSTTRSPTAPSSCASRGDGPDFNEGVDSYLERRPPAFAPLGEGTTYPWMKRDERIVPTGEHLWVRIRASVPIPSDIDASRTQGAIRTQAPTD